MGKIIAVVSGKGGTGKTTIVSSLSFALAEMGYKTLALDCDISLKNLDLTLGMSENAIMDFSDVMAGRCRLEHAIARHPNCSMLHFLTAPSINSNDKITLPAIENLKSEIKTQYDYCLVDAPAGMGAGFELAIRLADQVIIVSNPEITALRDAQKVTMVLPEFGDGTLHLIMNKINKAQLKKQKITIDDAIDYIGVPLLGIVPEDRKLAIMMNKGQPIANINSNASKAIRNIAKRILGKETPLERT